LERLKFPRKLIDILVTRDTENVSIGHAPRELMAAEITRLSRPIS